MPDFRWISVPVDLDGLIAVSSELQALLQIFAGLVHLAGPKTTTHPMDELKSRLEIVSQLFLPDNSGWLQTHMVSAWSDRDIDRRIEV